MPPPALLSPDKPSWLAAWDPFPLNQSNGLGSLCSCSPPGWQEQVCGLCGNFDGNQNNDFTSSSLQVEEDPVDFGNSWKVSLQCADTRKVCPGSLCSLSPGGLLPRISPGWRRVVGMGGRNRGGGSAQKEPLGSFWFYSFWSVCALTLFPRSRWTHPLPLAATTS